LDTLASVRELIGAPNGYYDGTALWQATLVSWCLTGNAYWLIVRDSMLRPIGLWYVPP
jgi:phage portal protein BeeE